MLGLITVEERRITGFRNDTNVVRVTCREWAGWLRMRMHRAGPQGSGGTTMPRRRSGFAGGSPQAAHRLKTSALQLRVASDGLRHTRQARDPAAALASTASGRSRQG